MRTTMMTVAAAIAVCLVSLSTSAADDGTKALIGVWKIVSFTSDGEKPPLPPNSQFVIEQDVLTFKAGEMTKKMPLKLDGSKSPKQIELTVEGPPGAEEKTVSQPGIYKFEGERLLICLATVEVAQELSQDGEPDRTKPATVKVGNRPTAFEDKQAGLFVLEREKE